MLRRLPTGLLLVATTLWCSAPKFQVADTNGREHSQAEWAGAKAILLFFVATDCPVANSYVPEMNRIHDAYAAKGVLVYAVQADPTVTSAASTQYAREFRYGFPMLVDSQHTLVKLAGATVTPQAAVLSPDGGVLYLGRIDNRVEDFDKRRLAPTEHELRDALDAVLAGKPVPHPRTKSIGCAIPVVKL
jgi:peroxiredoxin